MTSYQPLYVFPRAENRQATTIEIPDLVFASIHAFDIDYGFAWRDTIEAEYRLRYHYDPDDTFLTPSKEECILTDSENREKGFGPNCRFHSNLGTVRARISQSDELEEGKKRISWRRLLGRIPTRVVNFSCTPGWYRLVDGHQDMVPIPYVTDHDRKDWDDRCDATDLELMKLALSFVDSVPGLDGIFQDSHHSDASSSWHYGAIHTITDLRKYVSEGTPRRMTKAWKKGRERLKNPLSEWKYWLGL